MSKNKRKLMADMVDKSLSKRVEAIKRKKIASEKVVDLAEFRESRTEPETHTILVVDDDETMRNAIKRILEGEKFNVIVAQDGIELSKILESTGLDMVLLDVNLPWVDGYELCKLIKSHYTLKDVPLVFVSARKTEEDIKLGFAAGADDYIAKPFEVEHMVELINKMLYKKSS
ncbi:MAG: response regulator [Bdellovibrionota bacterium]